LIKRKIIIINPKDNVATALVDLKAGEVLSKEMDGTQKDVKLNQDIPFGHKIGILEIPAGFPVIKYGETIGTASMTIKTGDYVHIHNVKSNRGRGDIKGGVL
jgi:altronate dehydratase small subunit